MNFENFHILNSLKNITLVSFRVDSPAKDGCYYRHCIFQKFHTGFFLHLSTMLPYTFIFVLQYIEKLHLITTKLTGEFEKKYSSSVRTARDQGFAT